MVYSRQETHLWRRHRVFFRQEQLELKHATYSRPTCQEYYNDNRQKTRRTIERTPFRPLDRHVEVAQVIIVRRCGNPRCWVALKTFCLLRASNANGHHESFNERVRRVECVGSRAPRRIAQHIARAWGRDRRRTYRHGRPVPYIHHNCMWLTLVRRQEYRMIERRQQA